MTRPYTIEFEADIENRQFEVEAKGWSECTVVLDGERRISLNFYDSSRFCQELDDAMRRNRMYYETNLVVVSAVNAENMRSAVASLVANGAINQFTEERGE